MYRLQAEALTISHFAHHRPRQLDGDPPKYEVLDGLVSAFWRGDLTGILQAASRLG